MAAKRARGAYAATVLLTLVTGLVPPLQVFLVGQAVGSFEGGAITTQGISSFIFLGFLFGVSNAINSLRDVGAKRLATHLSVSTQADLLATVSGWPPAKLESPDDRDRLEIMWDTASTRINDFIDQGIMWVSSAIAAIGVVSVLFSVSPVVAGLIVLSAIGPVMATPYLYRVWNSVAEANAPKERLSRVLGVYLVSPVGFLDAVSSRSFPSLAQRHRQLLKSAAKNHLKAVDKEAVIGLFLALWTTVTLGGALLFLVQMGAGPGEVAATLTAMTTMGSIIGLVSIGTSLVQMTPFVVELARELDITNSSSTQPSAAPDALRDRKDFEARGVYFSYPNTGIILRNINCRFPTGSVTAIVGSNGVGKSTFLKVTQGLYEPTSGTLEFLDGDSCSLSKDSLNGDIYSMLQEAPRPPVPLRDYLSCGRELPDHLMISTLEKAGADFISPEDLDRMIGAEYEGGVNVSGGEWQRIAFARLLLSPASVWLLDEPSSALDPDAEAAMMDRLRTQLNSRAAVVVSHRLSTVLKADHVYVIDDGQVVEEGNPHALCKDRGSFFSRLFQSQIV